jgi:protoheme IX farnesyltransferase
LSTIKYNTASVASLFKQKVSDYKLLVKFRLALLVVFSACITFFLGASTVTWQALFILSLGGFLITGAANTLNQVLEKDYDKQMKRTANRPLPSGRMDVSEAVLLAGLMSVGGILLLSAFNPQTAVLGSLSLVSYAFVYTPMKRVSPIAVWVGAIPGALPMAIGWVAATGDLGSEALFLFSLQFMWQFPHFWAIAWVAYEDYAKAGFFLLPSKKKDGRDKSTALQCILYGFTLIPMSILPYYLDISGYKACTVMLLGGVSYTWYAVNLYMKCNDEAAKKLMFASFIYLPIISLALIFDKI